MADNAHICYQVGSDRISEWLTHTTGHKLLGIQLHFREEGNAEPLESILLYQVFLDNATVPRFYRRMLGDSAFKQEEVFIIEPLDDGSFQTSPSPAVQFFGNKAYQKLEFYPEGDSVDFAFFEETQLQLMIAFNRIIIFSGASISFGKQIGQYNNNEDFNEESFFALKAEGIDRVFSNSRVRAAVNSVNNLSERSTERQISIDDVEALISPVCVGPTCPPKWYLSEYFNRVFVEIVSKSPSQLLSEAYNALLGSFVDIMKPIEAKQGQVRNRV